MVETIVVGLLVVSTAAWLAGRWSRRRATERLRVSSQTVARLRVVEDGRDEDRPVSR